jgi:magnesium transporter
MNIDPAVASGPFITSINDVTAIVIYYGIALIVFSYLL